MFSFCDSIKLLRTAYKLSTRDLATILDIKAPSITAWESGKSQPTLEMFKTICNLFAVSSDFMLGYSSKVYNEEFLLMLEREIISFSFSENYSSSHKDLISDFPLPQAYIDEKQRIATYTQGMRANIIFLARMYIAYRIARYPIPNPSEQRYCKSLIDNKELLQKHAEQEYLYICRLNDILFKPTNDNSKQYSPYYDVEQLFSEKEK